MKLAIIFNLPRIIILTIFGVIIGVIAFYIAQGLMESAVNPIIANLQRFGYSILGIFILVFGAQMFVSSVEKREDLKEGKINKTSCTKKGQKKQCESVEVTCSQKPHQRKILHFIQTRFRELQSRPNTLFFLWGGILSFACLGEVVMVELTFFSGSVGFFSESPWGAAILGGFGMFLFAIAASIPIIIVSVISSSLSKYFKTIEKLESLRTIGAMVMIMVGLTMILVTLAGVIAPIL